MHKSDRDNGVKAVATEQSSTNELIKSYTISRDVELTANGLSSAGVAQLILPTPE